MPTFSYWTTGVLVLSPMPFDTAFARFLDGGTHPDIAQPDRMVFRDGDISVIVTGRNLDYHRATGLPIAGRISQIDVYDRSLPAGEQALAAYRWTALADFMPFRNSGFLLDARLFGLLLSDARDNPDAVRAEILATAIAGGFGLTLRTEDPFAGTERDDSLSATGLAMNVDAAGGDDTVRGSGLDDTILGGDGADVLNGWVGDDLLNGGAGNDRLAAHRGSDTLIGGDGDDVLRDIQARAQFVFAGDGDLMMGGAGNDSLYGGPGSDTLWGGEGHDLLIARGFQDDLLNGGPGNDVLRAFFGADTLNGGDGDDALRGFLGRHHLDGGNGNDTVTGGTYDDVLSGGAGHDILRGGPGDDTLAGGDGTDTLQGGPGDDILRGGDGDDRIIGGTGRDLAEGGAGADTFVFRPGDDRLRIADFDPAEDVLALARGLWQDARPGSDLDALLAGVAVPTAGGLLLRFDGGEEITLAGFDDLQPLLDSVLLL